MTATETVFTGLRRRIRAAAAHATSVVASLSPNVRALKQDATADGSTGASRRGDAAPASGAAPARRELPPAAQRALAEAALRRAEADRLAAEAAKTRPVEYGGRKGPEPTRYGDWENNGIASDF